MPERERERKLDEPLVRSPFPMTNFITTKDVFENALWYFSIWLRNVAMGTSTAWARVSGFASAYAPLLVSGPIVSSA